MTPTADHLSERIIGAAAESITAKGVARTSLADVARAAGCGRASLYRAFPGGKSQLIATVAAHEVDQLCLRLGAALDEAPTLEDALVRGITDAARWIHGNGPLQYVLEHEPEVVLPFLGFKQVDRLYAAAGAICGPHLERFVGPELAPWAVEWVARLVISHVFSPDAPVDLTDEDAARHLARTYLVPALETPSTLDLPTSPADPGTGRTLSNAHPRS